MATIGDVPPPPIVCALSERHEGSQIWIGAQIRSRTAQTGTYRLQVIKLGPAGSTRIGQQSEFALPSNATMKIEGLSLSVEPDARYQARLSILTGEAEYHCAQDGPDLPRPL